MASVSKANQWTRVTENSVGYTVSAMDALPDEMVLHVMSFLSPMELIWTASRVCQRWQDLVFNVALWAAAGGYCYHTPDSIDPTPVRTPAPYTSTYASGSFRSHRGAAAAPRTLSLHGRSDVAHLLLSKWRSCTVVQRLDLHACRLPRGLLSALADAFPELRALSLYDSRPDGSSLDYAAIADFGLLTALNISLCKEIPLGTVATVALCCGALEELRCEWAVTVGDEDVAALVDAAAGRLTVLALGGAALTDAAYERIARCSRLRELSLAPCGSLSDTGLLQGVAPLPCLRALQLTDAQGLSAQGLRTLLAHLASAPALRSLALAWCPALDDAAMHLAAARCPALERVSLRNLPALGDSGVAALLRGCPALTELNLVWNDAITGRHCLPLVAELAPRLRHLDLGYCDGIAEELVDALMARRRELKVTRPEGESVFVRGSERIDEFS